MTLTGQAIERLDTLVQQNGALVQQNSTLTGILEVCDMTAEERALGKKKIVEAIIKMGGSASEDDSLFALAAAIKKLKTLDPRTVVTDDLPRPVNVGTYICQPELLKNKIVHAYSEEVTDITRQTFEQALSLQSIDFPNAVNLKLRGFHSSSVLRSINLPKLKVAYNGAFTNLVLDYINIPNITTIDDHTFSGVSGQGVKTLNLPNLTSFVGNASHFQGAQIDKLLIPNAKGITSYSKFAKCTMKVLDISNWNTSFNTTYDDFSSCHYLIDLIVGKNIKFNFDLGNAGYNPATAYSKTSASLVDEGEPFSTNNQKWNYNLREHFAANLDDRTGLDAFTITFGSTVLSQMEEATIEAFTSKNWTLA